ncbi:MAG: D-alanyl-D-alanine carboxypeptidase, partial [Clostridia bacterium]|nr:D-alanyl-D-alanine carboxypeptidase [Clostridia bacterium]
IFLILIIFLIFINTVCYASTSEPQIYAKSAILIDSNTGKVLYSKNANEKKYPASTTKILTSILAIEKLDLNQTLTASESAISSIPSGYSNAGIKAGENLTVYELLEAYLVHSANEVGYILSENISNTTEDFADLMNAKAKEIGCQNTHFTNPSGLHDENHYTTAYDLALIARYCMKNETFRKIVSLPTCTIAATNKSGERHYSNTNEILLKNSKYYNENVIGIKTGYTKEAGNCLISAYSSDNMELISVVLDSPETTKEKTSGRFSDTLSIFKFAVENYKFQTIANQNSILTSMIIKDATDDTKNLDLLLENSIEALTSTSVDINNLEYEINLDENIHAPISKNQVLGTVTYTIDGIKYTENLIASHDVNLSEFWNNVFKITCTVLILIIVSFLIFTRNKK